MERLNCIVPGCSQLATRTGARMCEKHYMRNRRHGDASYSAPDALVGARIGRLTVVRRSRSGYVIAQCDCGELIERERRVIRRALRSGIDSRCNKLNRHGLADDAEHVGYGQMHHVVAAERGRASQHKCVDCNSHADEWSYDGGDPDEIWCRVREHVLAVGTRVEFYSPRCRPCHRRYDLGTNHTDGSER